MNHTTIPNHYTVTSSSTTLLYSSISTGHNHTFIDTLLIRSPVCQMNNCTFTNAFTIHVHDRIMNYILVVKTLCIINVRTRIVPTSCNQCVLQLRVESKGTYIHYQPPSSKQLQIHLDDSHLTPVSPKLHKIQRVLSTQQINIYTLNRCH